MLRILLSLWCVKYIFFCFIEALDSKGIIKMLKKVLQYRSKGLQHLHVHKMQVVCVDTACKVHVRYV